MPKRRFSAENADSRSRASRRIACMAGAVAARSASSFADGAEKAPWKSSATLLHSSRRALISRAASGASRRGFRLGKRMGKAPTASSQPFPSAL